MEGCIPLRVLAPSLYNKARRNAMIVKERLANNLWICDISRQPQMEQNIAEFLVLWNLFGSNPPMLQQHMQNQIIWKTTASGCDDPQV